MARTLVPKYKYVAIARDITTLLHLSPALEWWQVRDYYEPTLPLARVRVHTNYDDDTRRLIATAIDREMRYVHVR
jgi:hypothetical protein